MRLFDRRPRPLLAVGLALGAAGAIGACAPSRDAASPRDADAADACRVPPLLGQVVPHATLDLAAAGIATVGALQADAAGGLWVLDPKTPALVHFDPTGRASHRITARGDAPGALGAPQAIAVDRDGGVWVVDARMGRVDRFDRAGVHQRSVSGPSVGAAAIAAVSAAIDGDRLLLGQRMFAHDLPAAGEVGAAPFLFVRSVAVAEGAEADAPVGSAGAIAPGTDTATVARIAAPPFHGVPFVESVVAARPGGGAVVTYPAAYRLRWFDRTGGLEREVIGCQGGIDNAQSLAASSFERGIVFQRLVTAMQFSADGTLTVVLATPDAGQHRIDEYDAQGALRRSMRVASRTKGGALLTALVPADRPGRFWALDGVQNTVRLVELHWPARSVRGGASSGASGDST